MITRTLAAGAAAALVLGAPAPALTPETPAISATGVGSVKLGSTYRSLKRRGLVGALQGGCPFESPIPKAAFLKPPFEGVVEFAPGRPRKVVSITLNGGGTVGGLDFGASGDDVAAAFPRAKVNRDLEQVFRVTVYSVRKADGGPMDLSVDVDKDALVSVDLPTVRVCD